MRTFVVGEALSVISDFERREWSRIRAFQLQAHNAWRTRMKRLETELAESHGINLLQLYQEASKERMEALLGAEFARRPPPPRAKPLSAPPCPTKNALSDCVHVCLRVHLVLSILPQETHSHPSLLEAAAADPHFITSVKSRREALRWLLDRIKYSARVRECLNQQSMRLSEFLDEECCENLARAYFDDVLIAPFYGR